MSFILDALKKSEAERRKGEVPRLQNEPFSPPPRRRPVWPLLLAVALLLNGAVFAWWLLGGEDEPGPAKVAAVSAQKDAAADRTASAEPVRLPAGAAAPPETAGSSAAQEEQAPASSSPSPTIIPAAPAEPEVVTEVLEQTPVRSASPAASKAPVETTERVAPTPRVEAPAAAPARAKVAAVAPATESFPPVSELPGNVRAGLPRLDLQLHFYTPDSERRLVRLNGVNLRQGGSNGDGLNVIEITHDGVKLSYGGNRFFLPTGRP